MRPAFRAASGERHRAGRGVGDVDPVGIVGEELARLLDDDEHLAVRERERLGIGRCLGGERLARKVAPGHDGGVRDASETLAVQGHAPGDEVAGIGRGQKALAVHQQAREAAEILRPAQNEAATEGEPVGRVERAEADDLVLVEVDRRRRRPCRGEEKCERRRCRVAQVRAPQAARRRERPRTRVFSTLSSKRSASWSTIAPASSSASTMVTARR